MSVLASRCGAETQLALSLYGTTAETAAAQRRLRTSSPAAVVVALLNIEDALRVQADGAPPSQTR
jgi:hypothetical protein